MGVVGQRLDRDALPRERDLVPTAQEAGWAPGPVWPGEEYLALIGIQGRN
jgi:hypothetical protein